MQCCMSVMSQYNWEKMLSSDDVASLAHEPLKDYYQNQNPRFKNPGGQFQALKKLSGPTGPQWEKHGVSLKKSLDIWDLRPPQVPALVSSAVKWGQHYRLPQRPRHWAVTQDKGRAGGRSDGRPPVGSLLVKHLLCTLGDRQPYSLKLKGLAYSELWELFGNRETAITIKIWNNW